MKQRVFWKILTMALVLGTALALAACGDGSGGGTGGGGAGTWLIATTRMLPVQNGEIVESNSFSETRTTWISYNNAQNFHNESRTHTFVNGVQTTVSQPTITRSSGNTQTVTDAQGIIITTITFHGASGLIERTETAIATTNWLIEPISSGLWRRTQLNAQGIPSTSREEVRRNNNITMETRTYSYLAVGIWGLEPGWNRISYTEHFFPRNSTIRSRLPTFTTSQSFSRPFVSGEWSELRKTSYTSYELVSASSTELVIRQRMYTVSQEGVSALLSAFENTYLRR